MGSRALVYLAPEGRYVYKGGIGISFLIAENEGRDMNLDLRVLAETNELGKMPDLQTDGKVFSANSDCL